MPRDELNIVENLERIEQCREEIHLAQEGIERKLDDGRADEQEICQALANGMLSFLALARRLGIEPNMLFRQMLRQANQHAERENPQSDRDWQVIADHLSHY